MIKNTFGAVKLFVLLLAICSASSFAAMKNSNKKYDFSFVDSDYMSVFHTISEASGLDVLLSPELQTGGSVTLKATQKTWRDLLNIMSNMYGLTWIVENGYINVQKSDTYRKKQIEDAQNIEKSDETAPLKRRNFYIKHAAAADLAKVLDPMKSSRGKLSVIDRNNAIIVYDTEKRLSEMSKTLKDLDVETLQIVITAKLVVVDSRLAHDLGVDWTRMGGGAMRIGGANSRVSAEFSNTPNMTSAVSPVTALTVNMMDQNISATLANLLGDSRSEVLASPQISTLDHTKAEIFMGDQISIRVIDANGQSSTQMVESGIKLTVTPHVAGDNRILLDLHPQNNSYSYDDKGQPVISTQEAKTKVVVADGETVIIGGLTKNDEIEEESGIPFLKDIPILGYLFKHTRKEITKKDLVIFVTPRIVRNYLQETPIVSAPAPVSTSAPAPAAKEVSKSAPPPPQDVEYDEDYDDDEEEYDDDE